MNNTHQVTTCVRLGLKTEPLGSWEKVTEHSRSKTRFCTTLCRGIDLFFVFQAYRHDFDFPLQFEKQLLLMEQRFFVLHCQSSYFEERRFVD